MKKGTLELSMGFIVTVLLSIVVLGFGIAFVYNMYNGNKDLPKTLDKQISEEIYNSLSMGMRCYTPNANIKIERRRGGNSGKMFGIGVMNTIPGNKYFHVDYKISSFVNDAGQSTPVPADKFIVRFPEPNAQILNNEKKVFSLLFIVKPDTPSGSYFIDINICSDSSAYPSHCTSSNSYCPTQKLSITVV